MFMIKNKKNKPLFVEMSVRPDVCWPSPVYGLTPEFTSALFVVESETEFNQLVENWRRAIDKQKTDIFRVRYFGSFKTGEISASYILGEHFFPLLPPKELPENLKIEKIK